jgi:hypothetical protein
LVNQIAQVKTHEEKTIKKDKKQIESLTKENQYVLLGFLWEFDSFFRNLAAQVAQYKSAPFGIFSSILTLKSEKIANNTLTKTFLLQSNRNPELSMSTLCFVFSSVELLFELSYLDDEGVVHYKPLSVGSKIDLANQPEYIKTEIFFKQQDQALFLSKCINFIFSD